MSVAVTINEPCAFNLTFKPAEKVSTRRKDQTEDPQSSSTQHGAGVRSHLEAGLVVVCTAVQQGHTGCMAGAFLQFVSTLSPAVFDEKINSAQSKVVQCVVMLEDRVTLRPA